MDHHFHHIQSQQRQQPNLNVDFKKRPNTAIIMKQFYKPGERPKSSLQQHKLLEWKCECGEQLYVNKVMNLTVQSAKLSKAFPGRKIGLQNSNLIQKMKGNDLESKMKFKEMSIGSKISPYDILMEKYSQLKQQEEQQLNAMNFTNNYYDQQFNQNNQNFQQQNAIHFQPIPNFNNYQSDSLNNDRINLNSQQINHQSQPPSYNQSNFFKQGNPLFINNLVQHEEQFQEDQLQDEQQNSINIDSFQRPLSASNNTNQENQDDEKIQNVNEENEEQVYQEGRSSSQIQNQSEELDQVEDQDKNDQESDNSQQEQSQQLQEPEQQQQYQVQQEDQQNDDQVEKENLNLSGSNKMMQYLQYQQNILNQKISNQDQSLEEYPQSNNLEQHQQAIQLEKQEDQIINDFQKQYFEKRQSQLNKNKQSFGQNTTNQRFFSAAPARKQNTNNSLKPAIKESEASKNQYNQIHEFNYSIDNVSILSEKKPKRPQTGNLARPVNLNLDIKEVLTLKRVGSAQSVRNEQLTKGSLPNKFQNKQAESLPSSNKNQQKMANAAADQILFSDYVCNNAFHKPSSYIKNSSFYSLQQRTKLVQAQQSPQMIGQTNGNIMGLFQQPLINDLGKQVNIRQLKHNNKLQQQQSMKSLNNKQKYERQHMDTQTDEQDNNQKINHNFNNPTHYPFKVKNLVNQQTSQSYLLPQFSQSSKNILKRPQTSIQFKKF